MLPIALIAALAASPAAAGPSAAAESPAAQAAPARRRSPKSLHRLALKRGADNGLDAKLAKALGYPSAIAAKAVAYIAKEGLSDPEDASNPRYKVENVFYAAGNELIIAQLMHQYYSEASLEPMSTEGALFRCALDGTLLAAAHYSWEAEEAAVKPQSLKEPLVLASFEGLKKELAEDPKVGDAKGHARAFKESLLDSGPDPDLDDKIEFPD